MNTTSPQPVSATQVCEEIARLRQDPSAAGRIWKLLRQTLVHGLDQQEPQPAQRILRAWFQHVSQSCGQHHARRQYSCGQARRHTS
ncbi:MAG: hypothetical protein SF053_07955 [Bacteroidia bacterium]|nr:hypothetical protein [Bacteroidia bacterium]